MEHPFFNFPSLSKLHIPEFYHLTVKINEIGDAVDPYNMTNPPAAKLGIDLLKRHASKKISSMKDAEDLYLEKLDNLPAFRKIKFNDKMMINHIISASTLVGQKCRRRAGNIVIMNPKTENIYNEFSIEYHSNYKRENFYNIGDFTRVGINNNSLDIWISNKIPKNKIYVLYKDSKNIQADGSVFFINLESEFYYYLHEQTGEISDYSNYVNVLWNPTINQQMIDKLKL